MGFARVAHDQYHTAGLPVPMDSLAAGDLVFWGSDEADWTSVYHRTSWAWPDRRGTGDHVQWTRSASGGRAIHADGTPSLDGRTCPGGSTQNGSAHQTVEDWNCVDESLRSMEELRLTPDLERLVQAHPPCDQKADWSFEAAGAQ